MLRQGQKHGGLKPRSGLGAEHDGPVVAAVRNRKQTRDAGVFDTAPAVPPFLHLTNELDRALALRL